MKKIFVFPGQGSQFLGMGQDAYKQYDSAKIAFDKVDDLLNRKLSKIMFEGPAEDLNLTENTQPALMTYSMALLSVLLEHAPIEHLCSYVAGHSAAEYTALAAAGSIDLITAARLLQFRGRFMQEDCNSSNGAMAACINVAREKLLDILEPLQEEGICTIANDNSDSQLVISGQKDLVLKAIDAIKESGGKGILLNVNGAFHSKLMQGACDKMRVEIHKATFAAPKVPVVMNVSAKMATEPKEIVANLCEQIIAPVRWREIMLFALQNELEIVEIGAGQVLSNLAKRANYPFKVTTINDPTSLEHYLAEIN